MLTIRQLIDKDKKLLPRALAVSLRVAGVSGPFKARDGAPRGDADVAILLKSSCASRGRENPR